MHRLNFAALLFIALTPCLAPTTAHAEDDVSVFGNQALLEKHLATACDMVETVTGQKFKVRPSVRVSTPKEVAKILVFEFQVMPEEMIPAAQRETIAAQLSKFLMAKYEPGTHTIHMLPKGIERVAELQPTLPRLDESSLRVLLAHEATHALDFPLYRFQELRAKLKDTDAHQALNAIVEGHAEFVAEEVARRWNLTKAFERLEVAIAGEDSDEGTDTERALRAASMSAARFAYGQGHAFFKAIFKARGREAVEAALKTPPTRSRQIEEPDRWLNPTASNDERDLAPVSKSLGWLTLGEGWTVQTQRVLAAALKTQSLRLPKARRDEWLKGFQDAHLYRAIHVSKGASVIGVVMYFDSPAHAKLYADLDRLIVDAVQLPATMTMPTNEVVNGAGTGNKIPGLTLHRVIRNGDSDTDLRQQVFHHGRFAVELLTIDAPFVTRSHMDAAVARMIKWIDDPIAAAKLPALAAPTTVPTAQGLTLTLVAPDGSPVPDAHVYVLELPRTRRAFEVSDKAGRVHLDGLDPSVKYTMTVEPQWSSGPVASYSDSEWSPESQTIKLKPGWGLHCIVEGARDQLRFYVSVRNGIFMRSGRAGADGTFALYGIPQGAAQVIALGWKDRAYDPQSEDWQTVPQSDGGDPVILKVFAPKKKAAGGK